MSGFIGLHIGAGYHAERFRLQYEELCNTVCTKAVEMLKDGKTAVEVACFATKLLEDSELTNAGIGSNLTWDGTVECDASIMDGTNLNFGSIGAVSNVKNPILLARKVLDGQIEPLSLNRVAPCFMVGEGGRKLAEKEGLTVESDVLLTGKTLRLFQKCRRKAEKIEKEALSNSKENCQQRDSIQSGVNNQISEDSVNNLEVITTDKIFIIIYYNK